MYNIKIILKGLNFLSEKFIVGTKKNEIEEDPFVNLMLKQWFFFRQCTTLK